MKSIREKAVEYSRCIASSEHTREDFVSGANYVLDEIESIMEDKELDVEETYNEIYATIKQLKK